MGYKNFKVTSFDGLELSCRKWSPDGPVRARALYLHGYSEFLDCYLDWFPLVNEIGIEVIMYDQRGHGQTARSHDDYGVSNDEKTFGDLEAMVDYATTDYTGKLILWGFSMGGALVLNYMVIGKQKERFDLYISIAPFIEPDSHVKQGLAGWKIYFLPWLAYFWPHYCQTLDLYPEMLTNDPQKWEPYRHQPHRHLRLTLEFMNDGINRGRRLLDPKFNKNIVDRPLLLSHSTDDWACEFDASKKFIEIAPLSDKTLDVYTGLPHELMQCLEKDRMEHWRREKTWLKARL